MVLGFYYAAVVLFSALKASNIYFLFLNSICSTSQTDLEFESFHGCWLELSGVSFYGLRFLRLQV